jgi:hypothetical protein
VQQRDDDTRALAAASESGQALLGIVGSTGPSVRAVSEEGEAWVVLITVSLDGFSPETLFIQPANLKPETLTKCERHVPHTSSELPRQCSALDGADSWLPTAAGR